MSFSLILEKTDKNDSFSLILEKDYISQVDM